MQKTQDIFFDVKSKHQGCQSVQHSEAKTSYCKNSTPASPSTRVRKLFLFCSRQKHFKIQFQVTELFESYPGE